MCLFVELCFFFLQKNPRNNFFISKKTCTFHVFIYHACKSANNQHTLELKFSPCNCNNSILGPCTNLSFSESVELPIYMFILYIHIQITIYKYFDRLTVIFQLKQSQSLYWGRINSNLDNFTFASSYFIVVNAFEDFLITFVSDIYLHYSLYI